MKTWRVWLPTLGGWLLMAAGVVILFSSLCATTGGLVAAKRHAYLCLSPFVQPIDSVDDLGHSFIYESQTAKIYILLPPSTSMSFSPYLIVFASALLGVLLMLSGVLVLFGSRIAEYLDLPSSTRKTSARNERLSSRAKTRYIDLS